jgi:N-acyl-phosphatidylethanolamine-hydrolysing phospholipase D
MHCALRFGQGIPAGIKEMVVKLLFMFAAVSVACFLFSCSALKPDFDEEAWREKVLAAKTDDLYAPNNRDGVFFNPWMPMEKKGFWTLLRWRLSPRLKYTEEEKQFLPAVLPDPAIRIREAGSADFIFWVGHGTFFMRINGQYWLTDPMFSDRAVIPKRRTPPGISIDEIIDIADKKTINVIISHNHYDHLDARSVSSLPDNTRFYVPLGLKEFIVSQGKHHVVEMDWWQSLELEKETSLVCLPMQHWSRRFGQAFNTTLWASFLIASPDVSIYFDGDGGYFIGYREIGRRFPGIDYALIPTTAYHPRWFMHYAHMNVDEAIAAFDDLGASVFIPTQWGTFPLGDEPPGHPGLTLQRTISDQELDPERFLILDIGGLHLID